MPFPYSSLVKGAKYGIRELRVQCQGRPLRAFYTFDPQRQAVVLLGGDKTGEDRFYETMAPRSESIWEQYAKEQGFKP